MEEVLYVDGDKIEKPWGWEYIWTPDEAPYIGKIIHIDKGCQLSLQYHNQKIESVMVIKGSLTIVWDNEGVMEEVEVTQNSAAHIEAKAIHRFRAPAWGYVELVEVSSAHRDDIVRVQDDYGRV